MKWKRLLEVIIAIFARIFFRVFHARSVGSKLSIAVKLAPTMMLLIHTDSIFMCVSPANTESNLKSGASTCVEIAMDRFLVLLITARRRTVMTPIVEMFAVYGAWLGVFLFGMLWGAFIVAVNDPRHNHNCYDPDGKMSDKEYQDDQILHGI